MISWTFKLRWILWAAGGLGGLIIAIRRKTLAADLAQLDSWAKPRFLQLLTALCLTMLVLGYLAKLSQLHALALNAQDFWLFEDLTRNMSRGGWMLTRFAPQWTGITQHGAVHGTFTWALSVPLSWVVGSTHAALLYGPLALSLAGLFLGLLALPRLGAAGALGIAAGFMFSTQVGHVLMYDVHPEVAYPAAFLAWAFGLGLGSGHVRPLALALATLAGIGIKEDSFLVFFPAMVWSAFALKGLQRRAAIISLAGAVFAYAALVFAIGRWSSGNWGPETWEGLSVHLPQGPDLLQGRNWSSLGDAIDIVSSVIQAHGGIPGALAALARFLVSRPWLSLLIFAPWLVREARFWIWLLPLAAATAVLGRASLLNLYYSAPFLGAFWALAALSPRAQRRHPLILYWMAITPLVFGNGAPQFFIPSGAASELAETAVRYARCLPAGGRGLVQTRFLGSIPREHVATDRLMDPNKIDFALIAPGFPSYELPSEKIAELERALAADSRWKRIRPDCSPGINEGAQLWLKR